MLLQLTDGENVRKAKLEGLRQRFRGVPSAASTRAAASCQAAAGLSAAVVADRHSVAGISQPLYHSKQHLRLPGSFVLLESARL